jgi:ketosteroid isomerase-like protein
LGERHARAVASKDTARVAEIYAADVGYLPHDDPVEEGVAAARGAWVRGLSVPNAQLQYTPVSIEVGDGGMAYERGTVKATMKGKPLQPGNYLYVWRKRDGEWRVAVWMWNMQGAAARQ